MAREFPRRMISAKPFANEIAPPTEAFKRHQETGFATWRLRVEGRVSQPRTFSLAELRGMEVRSQITEIACEEGWSTATPGTPGSDGRYSAFAFDAAHRSKQEDGPRGELFLIDCYTESKPI